MFRPVRQRLVRTHPVTRRKSLYLSSHAGGIVGMPMPEARILLRDLNEHATQPKFVYVHQWRVGDLVMWDNRQMMHRVRRYDEGQPRDMRRTTVAGTAPTAAPFAAPFTAAPVAAESTWAAAAAPAAFGSFIDVDVIPAWSAPHIRHSYSSAACCAAAWPFAGKTTMPSFCLASFIVIV